MVETSLFAFLVEAILISLSGVMAPGPISAVAVGRGAKSPFAGAWVAVGHGIVELPLMALVFWGFGRVLDRPHVQTGIALVGGLVLLFMGVSMFRSLKQRETSGARVERMPLFAGISLSVGNPFILIWWATVGAALIARSVEFGLWGLAALALVHWSCDLVWCSILSVVSYRGGKSLGPRFQQVIFALCGVCLLFFGGKFILDVAQTLLL